MKTSHISIVFGSVCVLATLSAVSAEAAAPPTPSHYEGYFDLSDTAAQTYITQQLNAAGITSSKFPALFNALTSAQAIYTTADQKGIIIPTVITSQAGSALKPLGLVTPSYSQVTQTVQATSTSSIPNSPIAIANTVALYGGGASIGTTAGNITVGGGTVSSTATGQAASGVKQYSADGVSVFVYPASELGTPTLAALGLSPTTPLALATPLEGTFSATEGTSIDNVAPTTVKGNAYMKLCLGRSDADCDYAYPLGVIQLPQIGSVTFPDPVAANPQTNQPTGANFSASITLPDLGGACVMPNSSIASQMSVSGNVLSWNIDPAQFGSICNLYNSKFYGTTEDANYNLVMQVQSAKSGNSMVATVTSDQTTSPSSTNLVLSPMEFLYGCLAEGTLVSMDGTTASKTIETVRAGDKVKGPGGKALTVISYWKGMEAGSIYRIHTADKHTVDMTAEHPVPLTNATVKLAGDLDVGDEVTTVNGASKITEINKLPYGKLVYNLDIGAFQRSSQPIDMSAHSFYANGILVGDGLAQNHYGREEKKSLSKVLQTLKDEWRPDFFSAQTYKKEHHLN